MIATHERLQYTATDITIASGGSNQKNRDSHCSKIFLYCFCFCLRRLVDMHRTRRCAVSFL